ncbi:MULTISPECIES: lysine--tRNA ligase [Rhodomicrobium]|uniref:lysine--tRNA ligase n=1 Tax=Rhodomicrobium TaxID=1068 RepID=UPI000B4BF141|nr:MULTISPECIES: lysine--tRNA ligase [Rhodomicrobium]
MAIDDTALAAAAGVSKAWPFEEARKLVARIEKRGHGTEAIFSTGYGPSGLPHIGTFGEVARTSMVRRAYEALTGASTRLICFSDDMDALRKVPDNVPNREMLAAQIGKPLSSIPDPFTNEYPSFAAHNNARLMRFLDAFGFDYEFLSATECYKSGMMDATLLKMLAVYDKVMDIILPTLGEERRKTYSPFLPISERTGQVLQVPMVARDVEAGTITYVDPETGEKVETPVTGGRVKCQWKADWAMRWVALGVDYEMAGKDLIDSVTLSSKICKALGGLPPEGFNYELFLDEKGEKISKSKGNGITIDDWLTYAPPESLSLFMYQKPRTAKRLHFDVIPKTVDEYFTYLANYPDEATEQRLMNPVWHIHGGQPPATDVPVSFNLLLNLVSASNASDKAVLWGFIRRHAPGVSPATHPELDRLVGYAIAYFHDFVKPAKKFRTASDKERAAITELYEKLGKLPEKSSGEDIQNVVYEVGKAHQFEPLRAWFQGLYEVLLGQSQGPRFGSFVELYGIAETRALMARILGLDTDAPKPKPKKKTVKAGA